MSYRRPVVTGLCMLASMLATRASGAENGATPPPPVAVPASTSDEIRQLRQLLVEQQRQIDELRRALQQNQKPPAAPVPPSRAPLGDVASTTAMVPSPVTAAPIAPLGASPQKTEAGQEPSPLSLRIGSTSITPVGFLDFTAVFRDVTAGSGIGTNFGSFPYRPQSSPQGNLSEFRFSPQNSRIGVRFDAIVKGTKVLGYWESDFLGAVGNPPIGNVAVSTNSYPLRLRLFWVDLKKDKWEVLGGQTWSLMTPGRTGISPLPGDIFYSQVIDVNYVNGLVWGRIPEFRFVYRPTTKVSMALGLDSPEQYIGGSSGGSGIVIPSGLNTAYSAELSNGANTLNTPNTHPDIIGKIAIDSKMANGNAVHFEIAGVERTFRTYLPPTGQHFTKAGGAMAVNLNVEVVKGLRLLTNNYYSDGGGRYLFGQAPDLVVTSNGNMSLVHSMSTVDGFEFTRKNTLLYAYYGGIYAIRDVVIDTTGKTPALAGFGFSGAPVSQNKSIQEATFGFNQTLWKDPQYGALNFMGQYAYFTRAPWFIPSGSPVNAHMNEVFFNLRYTLPGSPPNLK